MSFDNGFRAYESAIICGLVAQDYSFDAIKKQFKEIRSLAREFSGGVSFNYYPIGADAIEVDVARLCLLDALKKQKKITLANAMHLLLSNGFSEEVARYAYREALNSPLWKFACIREENGVAVLVLRSAANEH